MRITNFTPGPIRVEYYTDKNGPIHPVHGQCWTWTGPVHKFYNRATIKVNGVGMIAARYVWELYTGEKPKECILHKCDNPLCVNPDHLFEGTRADNVDDMVKKGRHSKGEHGRHKLTAKQVEEIRRIYKARNRQFGGRALAEKYGVHINHICLIVRHRSRKHDGLLLG